MKLTPLDLERCQARKPSGGPFILGGEVGDPRDGGRHDTHRARGDVMTHWTDQQRRRLCELLDAQDSDPSTTWVGYWCSDAHGYSVRHGAHDTRFEPGAVCSTAGPLRDTCGAGQLHATRAAHRWPGDRVWIVALLGERRGGDTKSWSLCKEIVGEILPSEAILDIGVALRLRAWRRGADLRGADLSGADLSGADLRGADLSRANLSRANLSRANLSEAYLSGANLSRANLSRANLSGAYLSGADLSGAYLSGAYLSGAYLSRADLRMANLCGASLGSWERGPDGYARRRTI